MFMPIVVHVVELEKGFLVATATGATVTAVGRVSGVLQSSSLLDTFDLVLIRTWLT
jgi:hypothetical protein